MSAALRAEVLAECQAALPGWSRLAVDDVDFDEPKGFSSFTMGVRPRVPVEPPAVLYRRLEGKENAILDFEAERSVFLLLGSAGIAAECLHYDDRCRIEAFHRGRSLTAADLSSPAVLTGIAGQLHRFHQLEPHVLPSGTFFELLHERWGPMAERVLGDQRDRFPEEERPLCDELSAIHSSETLEKVLAVVPEGERRFCHNDTYHGNVMLLDDGSIRLVDFEFSCRNHIAFDFSNLFAETAMRHGLSDPPHFSIAERTAGDAEVRTLVEAYVANEGLGPAAARARADELFADTLRCIMLSDFMYAMAALPLAVEPIQKIRFLPYAAQRFARFEREWSERFGSGS